MTFNQVVAVIVAAMLLVAVAGLARMAWRTFHDNEEMVPGGSLGRQFLGGRKGKRARRGRKRRMGPR